MARPHQSEGKTRITSDWVRMPTGFPPSVTIRRPISRSLKRRITSKSLDIGRGFDHFLCHHGRKERIKRLAVVKGFCEIA